MFQKLGLQPHRKWDGSLGATLGRTQEKPLPSLAQSTFMPAGGHGRSYAEPRWPCSSTSSPGHPARGRLPPRREDSGLLWVQRASGNSREQRRAWAERRVRWGGGHLGRASPWLWGCEDHPLEAKEKSRASLFLAVELPESVREDWCPLPPKCAADPQNLRSHHFRGKGGSHRGD